MNPSAPTIGEGGRRKWVYPDRRSGFYAKLRARFAVVLILIYVVTPFLSFQGRPLLRFEVMSGNVYCFGQVFRYVDASYIVFLFLLAALGLFFATSVRGRLWCGFACPQTVFLDWVIRPIEEWIEGKAHRRSVQDKEPMTGGLLLRKLLKHGLFLGVACTLSNILLAYFVDPQILLGWMSTSPSMHFSSFLVMLVISGWLYFDFAWFREQFCSFLCPYARFQSVVMESSTPAVGFDFRRGEPRGKRNTGDCIDCGLCVRVCPAGIDIRNGLQLECIQCYRCVDACNLVMGSLERPLGLIRNLSLDELEGRGASSWVESLKKPRTIILLLLFVGLSGLFSWKLINRKALEMVLLRQPGPVFVKLDNGSYTNLFKLNLLNTTSEPLPLQFKINQAPGVALRCGGCAEPLAAYEKRSVALIFEISKPGETTVSLEHQGSGSLLPVPLIYPADFH